MINRNNGEIIDNQTKVNIKNAFNFTPLNKKIKTTGTKSCNIILVFFEIKISNNTFIILNKYCK